MLCELQNNFNSYTQYLQHVYYEWYKCTYRENEETPGKLKRTKKNVKKNL